MAIDDEDVAFKPLKRSPKADECAECASGWCHGHQCDGPKGCLCPQRPEAPYVTGLDPVLMTDLERQLTAKVQELERVLEQRTTALYEAEDILASIQARHDQVNAVVEAARVWREARRYRQRLDDDEEGLLLEAALQAVDDLSAAATDPNTPCR